MKNLRVQQSEPAFKPVEVSFIIQTKEEFDELYYRMIIPNESINSYVDKQVVQPASVLFQLWKALLDIHTAIEKEHEVWMEEEEKREGE